MQRKFGILCCKKSLFRDFACVSRTPLEDKDDQSEINKHKGGQGKAGVMKQDCSVLVPFIGRGLQL